MILALFLNACDSCGRIPLHDQFGIHTADWVPPTQQQIINDIDMEQMIADIPPLEEEKNNVRYAFVCGENCDTKF
jgi:hypothetical protein